MKVIGAFGMRFDMPRPALLTETELPDLTTAPQRALGSLAMDSLHIAPPQDYWTPLNAPVPGLLIEGTLPEDHAAKFLLRLPRDWNGRLVVAASSGVTDVNTYDIYFSDFLLSRGYAFACTDKGMRRAVLDGDTVLIPHTPENSISRWASRLEALASFSRDLAKKHRGRVPERLYAVGLSNGGYVARRAAESGSGLLDGAVEISGVLWREGQGNLLRQLPVALRATASAPWDRPALERVGFPASEPRWDPVLSSYRDIYWESSLCLFLGDIDPDYKGPPERYDLDSRPAAIREGIKAFENSGDLRVPLISISGRHDFLISCAGHAQAYSELVASRGKAALHRMILVDDASHIDTNRQTFPFIEPLMPWAHRAFEELVDWVEKKAPVAARSTAPSSRRLR